MLKSKASLERWAREVVRCEKIYDNIESSELEVEQAEWKIEGIMRLYQKDFEATMLLIAKIEELMFQEDLTK